jgi:hypothetical protein
VILSSSAAIAVVNQGDKRHPHLGSITSVGRVFLFGYNWPGRLYKKRVKEFRPALHQYRCQSNTLGYQFTQPFIF